MRKMICALLVFLLFGNSVAAETEIPLAEEIPDIPAVQELLPEFSFRETVQSLSKGDAQWDAAGIVKRVMSLLMREMTVTLRILSELILLMLLAALVSNLQNAMGGGAAQAAFLFCYLLTVTVLLRGFHTTIQSALSAMDSMSVMMHSLLPVALGLLASSGGITSANALAPTLFTVMQLIVLAVKNLLLPMLMASLAVLMADNLTGRFRLRRLGEWLRRSVKWILGFCMTLFIGIAAVQSIPLKALDGVAVKSAKFAVGSFVPVVGGLLNESFEMVAASSGVLKNAVGTAGMIAIILITATPILRLFLQKLLYGLTAAVLAPLSDEKLIRAVEDVADTISLIGVLLLSVAVLMLVNIGLVLRAGGFG